MWIPEGLESYEGEMNANFHLVVLEKVGFITPFLRKSTPSYFRRPEMPKSNNCETIGSGHL